ncbi:reverse transcriptase/maturase family protein [Pseudoalteromonas sp. NGC95]|uniref:reverse transcriptase/maturase family protein n=1 Tax=Pseudoalteromonas sp. NGC95 TaxID=2792051 RepID=UPI0018CE6CC2|nr:reverse transcriptase/maturase family protein [Pseudoalteromonas sp. NGC95]MBH0017572.1 group II intron reverse transcriptase domain-containing protein [Pseudoalteromonas sp. NGC95]
MNARNRFPLRGGNWNNGSNAGLGALNLNNARSNANSNIGFRPALDYARSSTLKGGCQCNFEKDAAAPAIAEKAIKPVDASTGCTYEQIYQFENILNAAYQCRKGKTTSASALAFFNNLEENIVQIQNELMWEMYNVLPYRHFYVFEPKRRLISAPHFKDRVIHRAIYNVIEPLFDKRYIHDSYACRTGKGAHAGADRAQLFIKQVESESGKAYALKADISKYFSSIDHQALKNILDAKLKCQKTKSLLFYIIDNSPSDAVGVGIPLGNLTSQIFANIYLHELDHFAKHTLKAKRYIRYMDDFVIIHKSKSQLNEWRNLIEEFLYKNLRLKTNSKTQVFPIAKTNGRSLDFLGYRIYANHRLLRKSSVNKISTKLKRFRKEFSQGKVSLAEINQCVQSWLGHASHADTHSIKLKLFNTPFKR